MENKQKDLGTDLLGRPVKQPTQEDIENLLNPQPNNKTETYKLEEKVAQIPIIPIGNTKQVNSNKGIYIPLGGVVLVVAMVSFAGYNSYKEDQARLKAASNRIGGVVQSESYVQGKYTIDILTNNEKQIKLEVVDTDNFKTYQLDFFIEKGTKIKFPEKNFTADKKIFSEETSFTPETTYGVKRADRIEIIK